MSTNSVYKLSTRCQECDAILWSQRAIELCLCPDCEDVDSDTLTDLEDKLESLLKIKG